MKLFFIMDGNGGEMSSVVETLRQNSHQVLYWVGKNDQQVRTFPGLIFHDHFAARKGIPPAGTNLAEFPPPDAELIRKLYSCESIAAMMKRGGYNYMNAVEFRRVYYDMLRYWLGVIKKFQPEAIIFSVVPHQLYNYVIYSLARNTGIATLMFDDTWVSDRALFYEDLWRGSADLHQRLESNKGKNFELSDLKPDLQDYYRSQKDSKQNPQPFYMKTQIRDSSGWCAFTKKVKIFWDYLKKGKTLSLLASAIKKILAKNSLKNEYKAYQTDPDTSVRYIFVPLNYQPERTSAPQGDMYFDQILIIQTLAAVLPAGWKIYVKEHPTQWWRNGNNYTTFRYKGYYKRIAEIPNTVLVPVFADTKSLIDQSQAVAVLTGTAAWEALLRGKPALIFGMPWFRDCSEIFRIDGVEACRLALRKIQDGFQVSQQAMINFLKSFDEATIRCYIDDLEGQNSNLNKAQRIDNLTKAILNFLKEIKAN